MRRSILLATVALMIAVGVGFCAVPHSQASVSRPAAVASVAAPAMVIVTSYPSVPSLPTIPSADVMASASRVASAVLTAYNRIHPPIKRWRAYLYAIYHERGCWYVWGGNGPCWAGYDCSGLVVKAYATQGIYLPRTTYEMLASPMLRWIPLSQARAGDLIFENGGGHVTMYTGHWGQIFQASTQGERSDFGQWWDIYGAYHVVGSG